jgi:hypothetical protein
MSDQILAHEEQKGVAENSTTVAGKGEGGTITCPMQGKGWLKGTLGMAICCAAPLLLVAAIAFFGLSLGAIASGAFSLAVVLACPVGMFLMMRMMNKKEKN